MIKCAIFDLDGTLLDTITTITYYVNRALSQNDIPEITEDECKYFIGNGARLLIKRSLEKSGNYTEEGFAKVYGEYSEMYNANTLYLTEPYEGIAELISALRERGIRLAVLSNKPDDTTKAIIPCFFGDAFDLVLGGRDGIPLKPAPDAFFEICEELSVSRDEVIYLGDTGVDMLTGKGAGAALTVGVSWGFRTKEELTESGADVIVDSPLEVLSLLN